MVGRECWPRETYDNFGYLPAPTKADIPTCPCSGRHLPRRRKLTMDPDGQGSTKGGTIHLQASDCASSHGTVHVDHEPRRLAAVDARQVVLQPLQGERQAR